MSAGMVGLDPADCRDLVKILKNSAQQLDMTSGHLNQAVARTTWAGPDSQRFRAQWPASRQLLHRSVHDLEDAASRLLQQIAEQERASSAHDMGGGGSSGDGGGSLWDDIVQGGKDLWDNVTEGVGNGLDWLGREIIGIPLIRPTWSFLNQLGHLGAMTFDGLTGNPPSLAAVAAQLALTGGNLANVLVNQASFGLLDPHLFDDGNPYAGTPIPVGPGTDRNDLTQPTSASTVFQGVVDAYDGIGVEGTEDGEVRIVKVEQSDGPPAYIVNIPGTENWGIDGSGQARDLTSNLMVMTGQSSTAQKAIELAMEKAGIPSDAPVMLVGHSQGGMLAINLASDSDFMAKYTVTAVMTAGSPVDEAQVDPGVRVLEVQHRDDVVPQLDLGGARYGGGLPEQPANVSVVTLDNPPDNAKQNAEFGQKGGDIGAGVGSWVPGVGEDAGRGAGTTVGHLASDVVNNHNFSRYHDSLAEVGKYPGIADYENDPSVRVFFTDNPDLVSAVDVPTGRR